MAQTPINLLKQLLLGQLFGQNNDTDDTRAKTPLDFSSLYESRPRFGRALLTIDDLPSDARGRYASLEGEIHAVASFLDASEMHYADVVAALRQKEEKMLTDAGLGGRYLFLTQDIQVTMIDPNDPTLQNYSMPSGEVIIPQEEGVEAVIRRINDGLADEKRKIDAWREELQPALASHDTLISPFTRDYVVVQPVTQHQEEESALVLCTTKTDTRAMILEFATRRMIAGEAGPVTKDRVLTAEYQSDLKNAHIGCDHGVYIISHPSDIVKTDLLSMLSGELLEVYRAPKK